MIAGGWLDLLPVNYSQPWQLTCVLLSQHWARVATEVSSRGGLRVGQVCPLGSLEVAGGAGPTKEAWPHRETIRASFTGRGNRMNEGQGSWSINTSESGQPWIRELGLSPMDQGCLRPEFKESLPVRTPTHSAGVLGVISMCYLKRKSSGELSVKVQPHSEGRGNEHYEPSFT